MVIEHCDILTTFEQKESAINDFQTKLKHNLAWGTIILAGIAKHFHRKS